MAKYYGGQPMANSKGKDGWPDPPPMPSLPDVPVEIERVRGEAGDGDMMRMLEEINAKLDEVLTSVNREQDDDDRIARM